MTGKRETGCRAHAPLYGTIWCNKSHNMEQNIKTGNVLVLNDAMTCCQPAERQNHFLFYSFLFIYNSKIAWPETSKRSCSLGAGAEDIKQRRRQPFHKNIDWIWVCAVQLKWFIIWINIKNIFGWSKELFLISFFNRRFSFFFFHLFIFPPFFSFIMTKKFFHACFIVDRSQELGASWMVGRLPPPLFFSVRVCV